MKTIIEGKEFELTPQEYIELTNALTVERVLVKAIKDVEQDKKRGCYKHVSSTLRWTKDEEKILREHPIRTAKRLLKGRSMNAIYERRSKLKIANTFKTKHRGGYQNQKQKNDLNNFMQKQQN